MLVLLHFMILKSAMSSVKEVKTALRKQMRTNLMGIGPEKILEASDAITDRLIDLTAW